MTKMSLNILTPIIGGLFGPGHIDSIRPIESSAVDFSPPKAFMNLGKSFKKEFKGEPEKYTP
jgi:hypothetical protein